MPFRLLERSELGKRAIDTIAACGLHALWLRRTVAADGCCRYQRLIGRWPFSIKSRIADCAASKSSLSRNHGVASPWSDREGLSAHPGPPAPEDGRGRRRHDLDRRRVFEQRETSVSNALAWSPLGLRLCRVPEQHIEAFDARSRRARRWPQITGSDSALQLCLVARLAESTLRALFSNGRYEGLLATHLWLA